MGQQNKNKPYMLPCYVSSASFRPRHAFFSLFFLFPPAASIHFNLPRFDADKTGILYQGDAGPSVGTIEFNKFDYLCRVGWATYAERVHLWDAGTGRLSDFTSKFTVTIDTQGRSPHGHGVAFFLAPVGFQIPPNSAGGFLGLFNTTTSDSAKNQIVSVEFDSFPNHGWDPLFEHVGINNNSISSAVYVPWNTSFHSGDPADVLISYNATSKNLSVSWSYQRTDSLPENRSLSYHVDLTKVLPEWVMIGFSAATGSNVERHTLESWEFSSSLNIRGTNSSSKRTKEIVGTTVASGALLALVLIGLAICLRKRKIRMKRREAVNLTSITNDLERGAGPRRFSYEDLASATNNFSIERKLGEGGFGAVYKGYLQDLDMAIAVKKISRGSKQGKKEYITEVKIISQLRHRYLVQLIGWCHDRGEFLLVYEFVANGSVDSHLFGKKKPLTWSSRYKIAQGLASALLYLHEEWEQCVVHRDIKLSNIMLDSSYNVKLGDFGLARLMDHELGGQTTRLVGTFGYMAPEYIITRRASKESDVYSFGVVVLELATGRKVLDCCDDGSDMGLVQWVWHRFGARELIHAIDARLCSEFDINQADRLLMVGLWCCHPDSHLRPSIRQAIQALNFEANLPDLPDKMPAAVYAPNVSQSSSEPSITNSSAHLGR